MMSLNPASARFRPFELLKEPFDDALVVIGSRLLVHIPLGLNPPVDHSSVWIRLKQPLGHVQMALERSDLEDDACHIGAVGYGLTFTWSNFGATSTLQRKRFLRNLLLKPGNSRAANRSSRERERGTKPCTWTPSPTHLYDSSSH